MNVNCGERINIIRETKMTVFKCLDLQTNFASVDGCFISNHIFIQTIHN